jgi:phospholipase C
VPPDAVPPRLGAGNTPGAYDIYGLRVPAVVVSPYARKDYVSHVVHDHTSILKLLETKFNLPALTDRDGAADNLLDCLDLESAPAFLTPPSLPAPLNPSIDAVLCTSPGPVPNPGG